MTVPQLWLSVAGLPPPWPGFDPSSGHVRYVVDKVPMSNVSPEYFGFPQVDSVSPHSTN
jgi:hypothetical protein